MGVYQAPIPGGGVQPFTIKGDTPSETEQVRIDAWIQQNIPAAPAAAPAEPEERGFWGSVKHGGIAALRDDLMFRTAAMGAMGDTDALRRLQEEGKTREEEEAKGPQAISKEEAWQKGIPGLWRLSKEFTGELAGQMSTSIPAFFTGPAAPVAVPAAFVTQGFATGLRANLLEQMGPGGKSPEEVSGLKAAATALPVALLGAVAPSLGIGLIAKGIGFKAAEAAGGQALTALAAKGITGQAALGMIKEAATMAGFNTGVAVGDTVGRRWQADLDLTSPEAKDQYIAAAEHGAASGAVMGAAFGAVAGARTPGMARAELGRQAEVTRQQEAARAEAERLEAEQAPARAQAEYLTQIEGLAATAAQRRQAAEQQRQQLEAARLDEAAKRAEDTLGRPLEDDERTELGRVLPGIPATQRGLFMNNFIIGLQRVRDEAPPPPPRATEPPPPEPTPPPARDVGTPWTDMGPTTEQIMARAQAVRDVPTAPAVTPETTGVQPTAAPGGKAPPVTAPMPRPASDVTPPAPPEVTPPPTPPPTPPVTPPFVPSTAMRKALTERGYTWQDIRKMTPEQANEILAKPVEVAKAEKAAADAAPKAPPEPPAPPPQGLGEAAQDRWAKTSAEPPGVGAQVRSWLARAVGLGEEQQRALVDHISDWAEARRNIDIGEHALETRDPPEDLAASLRQAIDGHKTNLGAAEERINRTLGSGEKTPPVGEGGGGGTRLDMKDSAGTTLKVGDTVRTTSVESGSVNNWTVVDIKDTPSGPRVILSDGTRTTNMSARQIAETSGRLLVVPKEGAAPPTGGGGGGTTRLTAAQRATNAREARTAETQRKKAEAQRKNAELLAAEQERQRVERDVDKHTKARGTPATPEEVAAYVNELAAGKVARGGKAPTAKQRQEAWNAAMEKLKAEREAAPPAKPVTKVERATKGRFTQKEDGLHWSAEGRLYWQDRAAAGNRNRRLASQIDRIQQRMDPVDARVALTKRLEEALAKGTSHPMDIALLRDAANDMRTTRKLSRRDLNERRRSKGKKAAATTETTETTTTTGTAAPKKPRRTTKAVVEQALDRPLRNTREQAQRDEDISHAVFSVWNRIKGIKVPGIPTKEALRDIVERFDAAHPNDDPMAIASNHVNWRLQEQMGGYEIDTPYKEPPRVNFKPDLPMVGEALRKAAGRDADAVARGRGTFDIREPLKPDPWGLGMDVLAERTGVYDAENAATHHITDGYTKEATRDDLDKLADWMAKATEHRDDAKSKSEILANLEDRFGPDRTESRADRRIKLDHSYTLSELVNLTSRMFLPRQRVILDRALALVGDTRVYVTQTKHLMNAWDGYGYIPKSEPRPPVEKFDHDIEGFYHNPDTGNSYIVIGDTASQSNLARVILHEALHPVFNKALTNRTFAAQVRELFNEVKGAYPKGEAPPYGMKDVLGKEMREFFTEGMSNPEFQRYLENVVLSPEYVQRNNLGSWVKTKWDGLVDVMRKALGMPNRRDVHTALDEMMRLADVGFKAREEAAAGAGHLPTGMDASGRPRDKDDPFAIGMDRLPKTDGYIKAAEHITENYTIPATREELGKLADWWTDRVPGIEALSPEQRRAARARVYDQLEDRYGPDRAFSRLGKNILMDHEYTVSQLGDLTRKYFTPEQLAIFNRAERLVGDTSVFMVHAKHLNYFNQQRQYKPWNSLRPPVDPNPRNSGGFYSPDPNSDWGPHIVIRDTDNPQNLAHYFIHEVLHPVFDKALKENKNYFGDRVNTLYWEVKDAMRGMAEPYGMKKQPQHIFPHEFFTEGLTNRQFQKYLDQVVLSDDYLQYAGLKGGWVKTAWDGLVNVMREALGQPATKKVHTALDEMMRLADEGFRNREEASGVVPGFTPPPEGLSAVMESRGGFNVGLPGGPVGHASPAMQQGATQGGAALPGQRAAPQTPHSYNEAIFTATNHDTVNMMRKMFGGAFHVLAGDRAKGEAFAERLAKGAFDSYRPLDRMVQDAIANGGNIALADNPYHKMQASNPTIARLNDEFMAKFVRPLADKIKNEGLTFEEILPNGERGDRSVDGVARLLAERDRNIYGRQKDPTGDPWAGIDDAEINRREQAIMNDPTFDYARHRAAADLYFGMTKYANDARVASGMLDPNTIGMGAHWLPLRDSQARADAGDEAMRSPFAGKLGVAARLDPKTSGREGRSQDNILQNIANLVKDTHRHGEHNLALQDAYKMGQDPINHPFVQSHGTDASQIKDGHKLMVKIGGVQHFMQVGDHRVATMFNTVQQHSDAANGVFRGMQHFNNWMRKASTVFSPEFIISNAVRDTMEAAFKGMGLQGGGLKTAQAIRDGIMGFTSARKAMVGLLKAREDIQEFRPTNDWERAALEYTQHGGEAVSWGDTRKSTARELDDLFHNQDVGTIRRVGRAANRLMEIQGGAIENATRLSVFKALRDQGIPAEAAAAHARNVTVNFAQKGDWAPVLNSLYLFYNAGMQGTVGMVNAALRSGPGGNRVRTMLGGVVAMGGLNAVANSMLMGQDESGLNKWDGIPEYDKQSNIILAMPWDEKGYVKIPLPHGLAALYNLGRVGAEMAINPPKTAKEGTGRVSAAMGNMLEQIMPFGQTSSFINFISPSVLRPFVQAYAGRDALGRDLSPQQASMRPGEQVAPSQNFWNSASPVSVAISDWLHEATGGQGKHIQGALEVPPGQISNFVQTLTGGAGGFIERAAGAVGRRTGVFEPRAEQEGEQWSDVPFARRFVGDLDNNRIAQSRFLDAQERINSVGKEYDEMVKNPTPHTGDDVERLLENHREELIAYQSVKGLGKTYTNLGQALHKIQTSEMDSTTKTQVMDSIKAQRSQLQRQMMGLYHQFDAL